MNFATVSTRSGASPSSQWQIWGGLYDSTWEMGGDGTFDPPLKEARVRFPSVSGSNLKRRKLALPQGFEGDINLIFIAFQQWQQGQVDTWLPFARELEQTHAGVRYYELPTIKRMNGMARTFINEGMRAGIPDPVARERTITLYLDKRAFRRELQLPHEDEIYVLLLDHDGQVRWSTEGAFTPGKGESLMAAVQGEQHNEVT